MADADVALDSEGGDGEGGDVDAQVGAGREELAAGGPQGVEADGYVEVLELRGREGEEEEAVGCGEGDEVAVGGRQHPPHPHHHRHHQHVPHHAHLSPHSEITGKQAFP